MKRPRSKLGCLLGVGAAIACTSSPPPKPPPAVTATPPPPTVPEPKPPQTLAGGRSRYLPGPLFKPLGDGRSAAVAGGRRVVIKGDQAQVIDARPIDDIGFGKRIPDSLGGGWAFVGRKTVRYGRTYDGALIVIASAPSVSEEIDVGVGHKRLLVRFEGSAPSLHELPSGKTLPLDPPNLSQLFGTENGFVAAATSKGELWASSRAGAAWKKIAVTKVSRLAYDGKGIVVASGNRTLRLGFDGKLSARPNEPGMIVSDNLAALELPFDELSKPPHTSDAERLISALTARMNAEAAFYVDETDLVFIDARTGKLVQKLEAAFSGKQNCFPIRGGLPSFVGCNAQQMALYRIDSVAAKPVLERSFKGVLTQSFGEPSETAPLAFSGRCDGSPSSSVLCLREAAAKWRELTVSDPSKLLARVPYVVHVAASTGGQVFAFGWLDGSGDLVIVDGKQRKVRRIPKSDIPAWAAEGIDWHALTIERDALRFLLNDRRRHGPSSGVLEIASNDHVSAQRLDGAIAASGARALQSTTDGKLRETLDAGRTFREIEPPPGGVSPNEFFNCHPTGCEVGSFFRAGWGSDED